VNHDGVDDIVSILDLIISCLIDCLWLWDQVDGW